MAKNYLAIIGGILTIANTPVLTFASPMTTGAFNAAAAHCAPAIPAKLLEAVAYAESAFDPWVLHDDTTDLIVHPKSLKAAISEASAMYARGDSFDLGLMQINSANLDALGMNISLALNPCTSLAGAVAVLQAAYSGGATGAEQEVALLMALSRYNTGSPLRGIMNGYARRVETYESAGQFDLSTVHANGSPVADPDAPPSWDVSAMGTYAQSRGSPWLVEFAGGTSLSNVFPRTIPIMPKSGISERSEISSSTKTIARSQ